MMNKEEQSGGFPAMNEKAGPFRVVDIPVGRRIWINVLHLPRPKNVMYGLLEVDVTVPRQIIAAYKAHTGETLSFTGFLTYCLARAVEEEKSVQTYFKGRKQFVIFDDVNVGMMIESKMGEKRALMGTVIRGANHKSYLDIHREIRAVQLAPVPANRGMPKWFRSLMLLPWPLSVLVRTLFASVIRRDPTIVAAMDGTVAVTAVGMFGEGHSGWGIFPTPQVLGMVVGSIAWKPAVVEGRVEPREILHLTLSFDHDVVDGGPAARFTRRLVELIESGYGLPEAEELEQPVPAVATAAPGRIVIAAPQ
jgi:pyruvate/2-oxoglutarate dehydrogenase complex dihydrolipoamide acyltransferase (E2) component